MAKRVGHDIQHLGNDIFGTGKHNVVARKTIIGQSNEILREKIVSAYHLT